MKQIKSSFKSIKCFVIRTCIKVWKQEKRGKRMKEKKQLKSETEKKLATTYVVMSNKTLGKSIIFFVGVWKMNRKTSLALNKEIRFIWIFSFRNFVYATYKINSNLSPDLFGMIIKSFEFRYEQNSIGIYAFSWRRFFSWYICKFLLGLEFQSFVKYSRRLVFLNRSSH